MFFGDLLGPTLAESSGAKRDPAGVAVRKSERL